MFCKYKEIFGKPNEGFHKERFLGLAVYDLFGFIILVIMLSFYLKIKFSKIFLILAFVVILIHRMFCINTTLNVLIFGEIK